MPFDQFALHPIIARNLELMGYRSPTPIQAQSIEPAIAGRDLIGLAQTGTGKTAAFIVPIAHHVISHKPPQDKGKSIEAMTRLRALVLCPTRELAQQVADETARIVQGSVLRVGCAYGKVAISPQIQAIARGIDILVATPGRIRELLDAAALSLAHVKHVVIDEADRMMDMGFLPQVRAILQVLPFERQSLLFTATMPPDVEELARELLRDPQRIEVGRHTTPVSHVRQHLAPVHDRDKVALILHLLSHGHRQGVLIFCNTKRRVGWVGTALERNHIKVGMLHGDRSQAQREKALARFANNELHALVATDVAARGLHIPAVRTVINYDLPNAPEEYVHRIGRAAHGAALHADGSASRRGESAFGESFTLLSEHDRVRWRAVCDTAGVQVFAEHIEGFTPTVRVMREDKIEARARRDRKRGAGRSGRGDRTQRRSRKSRPIKKGQKPGRGVVRPPAP
jgi:ATP-dependent RNA helicase RhlE